MKKFLFLLCLTLTACTSTPVMDNAEHTMVRPDQPDVHTDHDSMTMDDMVHALEGLEGDAFDEAFLRMMIAHHEGAIDMADRVLEDAGHEELKQMAREIISAQQREIDQMNAWLIEWGYEP